MLLFPFFPALPLSLVLPTLVARPLPLPPIPLPAAAPLPVVSLFSLPESEVSSPLLSSALSLALSPHHSPEHDPHCQYHLSLILYIFHQIQVLFPASSNMTASASSTVSLQAILAFTIGVGRAAVRMQRQIRLYLVMVSTSVGSILRRLVDL